MPIPKVIAPPTIIPSLTNLSMFLFMILPPVRKSPTNTNPREFITQPAPKYIVNLATISPIQASKIPINIPTDDKIF